MDKSPDAFRTISEVAESLDTPAHVLRFWESRFPQIKPVKRAGGRRYYRPSDVALLTGIKRLLHDEGLTIRGVQKILRDQAAGLKKIAAGRAKARAGLRRTKRVAAFRPALRCATRPCQGSGPQETDPAHRCHFRQPDQGFAA